MAAPFLNSNLCSAASLRKGVALSGRLASLCFGFLYVALMSVLASELQCLLASARLFALTLRGGRLGLQRLSLGLALRHSELPLSVVL